MALTDAELVKWLLSVPVKVAELALPAMGIPLAAWQAYLQAHGWVCAGGFYFGSVWCQREGGPEIVLATPGGGLHTPRNHGQRLDALEQVEHRSQLAILAEIMGYLPTEVTANPEPSPPFDDDPALSAALVREPEKAAAVVCVPDGATTPDPEMRRAHEIIGGALAGTLKAVEDALEETGAKPAGPLQITTQRTEDGQTEITATLRTVRGRPLVAPPEWPEKPKVHCDGCIWRQDRGLCFCPGLCIRDVAGEILPRPVWVTNPDRDCQHWEKREE